MEVDYARLLERRNELNAFGHLIGLRITRISQGYAEVEMPITKDHLNPIGSVHGGCLATAADVVGGSAASSYGFQVTTLDGTLHYLRPGLNATCIYGKARELKHGKRISVYEISIEDQKGAVLTEGIFTYMSLGKPILEDQGTIVPQ